MTNHKSVLVCDPVAVFISVLVLVCDPVEKCCGFALLGVAPRMFLECQEVGGGMGYRVPVG